MIVGRSRRSRPDPSGRGRGLARKRPAGRDRPGGGQGRRHPRQRHASRRISLSERDDRGERDRGGPSRRREPPAFPRLVLHLSEVRASADHRGRVAHRSVGADQRGLRHRQDRRGQALPGLSQAVRARLHLGDADQSLRSWRQLRSQHEPCAARADPQGSRGAGKRAAGNDDLGQRRAAPRISPCRRLRRRACPSAESLFRDGARQRRLRRGPHHPRTRRTRRARGRLRRPGGDRSEQAGRRRPFSCLPSPRPRPDRAR